MENPAATPPTSGDLQDAPATATAAPPAARAVKATKVYGQGPTAVVALDEIDLDVEAGRFTAIMGPSGSGKSTLMHCMAGLDYLTSGQVFIGDQDLGELSEDELTLSGATGSASSSRPSTWCRRCRPSRTSRSR